MKNTSSKIISLTDFPRAILHIDGDCFFASCEIALNPKLKGLPVITGKERGIASSMSYEAKALGVKRGMSLPEIKKICPSAIVLSSNYEAYSLFSLRMYSIVRRYTPQVEEYSIDECFADLTGLQRPLNMSYQDTAQRIKRELDTELGMTFSVGLAPTKVLAKAASKWKKPSGLTIISGRDINIYLQKIPLEKIWGIGPTTSAYLYKYDLRSALDFTQKNIDWIKNHLTKPHQEIWQELRGVSVYAVNPEPKNNYKSISKTKTFLPSSNPNLIFSHLSKNIENACIKARRHKLVSKKFYFFLKNQNFQYQGAKFCLSQTTSSPQDIINTVKKYFNQIYQPQTIYRATGITLAELSMHQSNQLDLFGQARKVEKFERIFTAADQLSKKFGKHTVFLGASLQSINSHPHISNPAIPQGQTSRQHLNIPILGLVK